MFAQNRYTALCDQIISLEVISFSNVIETYVTELAGKNKYNTHREIDGKNKNSN